MSNEELEKIREKYNELKDKRTEILKLGEAIEIYKQIPIVKKYLELVQLYKQNTTGIMYDFDKKTDDDLLTEAIRNTTINNPNNIYVHMGTFIKSETNRKDDYRVNKDHPNADYRIYRNLELKAFQDDYEIIVPINKCKQFEQEHIVIYPKTGFNDEIYLMLREDFFGTALDEGSEHAIKKILNSDRIYK